MSGADKPASPGELRPCPLCGSSDIDTQPRETWVGSEIWDTEFTCRECELTFVGEGNLEEARAAWNTRLDELLRYAVHCKGGKRAEDALAAHLLATSGAGVG